MSANDDLLAIRNLVETYASCADRRDPDGIAALFLEDGSFTLFLVPGTDLTEPTAVLHGRDSIAQAMHALDRYDATMHIIGNHVATLDGERATGEARCVAHHIVDGVDRVMLIRYVDSYIHYDGVWYFNQRVLYCEALEDRTWNAV